MGPPAMQLLHQVESLQQAACVETSLASDKGHNLSFMSIMASQYFLKFAILPAAGGKMSDLQDLREGSYKVSYFLGKSWFGNITNVMMLKSS